MIKNGFFYGAGWNAEQNLERWMLQGYDTYCFIDVDINKQHKQFAGRYEVLSLQEAIKEYGEQTLFITLTEKYWTEVVDFLRKEGIDEKNIVLLGKSKLNPQKRADDHISAMNEFLEFGKRSKNILDLGCGDGRISRTIVNYYNCNVKGIDVNCTNKNGEGWSTETMDARKLEFPDNSFDAIISIATLEHLSDLERVFSEMYRVLRPNGRVYMTGGPIWGSSSGNHYNHQFDYDPIFPILPRYCHLYMSKNDMTDFLTSKGFNENTASYVNERIFDADYLNRLSATQIVEKVLKSDFRVNEIKQKYTNAYKFLSPEIREKLETKYLMADLAVNEITVKLMK